MVETRTEKSVRNAKVALIFYLVQILLGFFSRKAFFDYLGSEILGLNTTVANLLGFLNLAELGIGTSVGYFLYKPLFEKDHEKINEIVSLQGWLYRKIAYFMLGVSAILMVFFPLIFAKSPLSLWYSYSTFGVLLFSSMLGYFFNYRQIVLNADQKGYKIQIVVQGFVVVKTIIQILGITYSAFPYVFWIVVELLSAVITSFLLHRLLKKEYSWLKGNVACGKSYLKKYPEVLKKTKQAFFHKMGGVILSQSSHLVIYAFTSLSIVALYGNYLLIVSKVGALMGAIFNSTGAAVGNLVASNDRKRIIDVFWELSDSRMCISTICILCLFYLTNPLITLWLGANYCLGKDFLLLFIILTSISMLRTTVDSYIYAYGLFQDVWAPVLEAVLNLGLSICLGYFWSLNGIVLGIILSQMIIILIWKPYFLFVKGIEVEASKYFVPTIFRYAGIFFLFVVTYFIFDYLQIETISNLKQLIISSLYVFLICTVLTFGVFYLLFHGTRDFVSRLVTMFKRNNS